MRRATVYIESTKFDVAHLVATHFIDNPLRYKSVQFIDNDEQNCHVSNLLWYDPMQKQDDGEIWRDVVDYIGRYQVSNLGNVRSLKFARKPAMLCVYTGVIFPIHAEGKIRPAEVINGGTMIYDTSKEFDRQRAETRFNQLISKGSRIELKSLEKRSLNQNNYLHLILSLLAIETGHDLEYAKEVFYKRAANKDIFVRFQDDELLGKVEYLRSSASLSQEEFSTSIDRLRDWSSQVAGIYLPSPNEDEFLASIEVEMSKYSKWI